MNILVLRSVQNSPVRDPYSVRMNTTYADRVLGHLTDKGNYCNACQARCLTCRASYDLDFSEHISGVIEFPAVLPAILDEPQAFLPEEVPDHDVLLALSVNEEILIEFVERFDRARGIIVPIEESDWISPYAITQLTELCSRRRIEIAFPKPFCSFEPAFGTFLYEFRKAFRIGKPEIDFTVENGRIVEARVACSAPCGATYYTARWLKGEQIDENIERTLEKLISCYPCTAGHMIDSEFNDSIMHQACKIQRQIALSTDAERTG